jgi:hypothetical protein
LLKIEPELESQFVFEELSNFEQNLTSGTLSVALTVIERELDSPVGPVH